MKREMYTLTACELEALIKRVDEVMSDEFNITKKSINVFWECVNVGGDHILDGGKYYTIAHGVDEIEGAEDAIEASQGEVGL